MALFSATGKRALRMVVSTGIFAAALLIVRGQAQSPPQIAAPAPAQPASSAVSRLGGIAAYLGMPVSQVEFRGINADPHVIENLRQLIQQKPGAPLDRQKIGRSLRALYATGRFADLQVEAQRTDTNQVALVFIAQQNIFIGAITVEGAPSRPSSTQLADATKLELGKLYNPADVPRALELMKTVLSDNGYYEATVTMREEPRPEEQTMLLHFVVTAGPLARVGQVAVEGSPGISNEEVLHIAKMHPGNKVNPDHVTRALTRLRKHFSKIDRLEAQISIGDRRYHEDSDTLDYVFRIVRGPVIGITTAGAEVSKGKLRQLVPVYEEHAVDNDLLSEGRRNIRDYLQTQGYFDAEVNFNHKPDPAHQRLDILYSIEKGVRHDLTNIFIQGNKYFRSDVIRERMAVQSSSTLLQHGRFSQDLLNHDVGAIRDLYLANGFEQVKVEGSFQDNYQGKEGRMAVFIKIDEGPQTLVGSVTINGTHVISQDELRPLLTNIEGQPFSQNNLASDRDTVLNYYFNRGFPDVVFTWTARPDASNSTREIVSYTVDEGPQIFVDHIRMTGLRHTKAGVARRQFTIHANEPLSQYGMQDTQRRLYDLGVFNAVNMAVQNPDGEAHYKDLYFQYEEARRWTFTYGLGLEIESGAFGNGQAPQGTAGASPRVSFDVTRINVGGRAHTLSFKSHVGRLQQRGLLSYDAPRFLTKEKLRLTVSAFYDYSIDVRTFTSQRQEASTQLEHRVSRATSLLYRFTYRRVRASNLVVDPSLVPLYSRPVRVGLPSLTYTRDTRDDPIDSHNGTYNSFDTGVAAGAFGSEAAFGRFLGQNTSYHSFHAKRWVFARTLRLGLAEPFGSTLSLPLPERFFAGGGNSLRGFALNQAGPRDPITGEPIGGNAMVLNSFELRTPGVPLPWIGNTLSFVFFHDAGNVFASATDMLHHLGQWNQPNRGLCLQATTTAQSASNCNFNYVSQSVGGGLRYRTPIGPVRLDLGYNLNPPTFAVFTTDPVTKIPSFSHIETLKRFNFFFSIGQTF